MWSKEIQTPLVLDEFYQLFPSFLQVIKPTKLRYFQYRVLTRTLTTNIHRHKWDPQVDESCTFCSTQKETMAHLLWSCPKIQGLWSQLSKWIEYFLGIGVMITLDLALLNNYTGKHRYLINLFIVILKQYIYAAKCLHETPSFTGFVNKISYWYNVDRYIVYESANRRAISRFHKIWGNIF